MPSKQVFLRFFYWAQLAFAFLLISLPSPGQSGKDGARIITAVNTVVNDYTTISANVAVGATAITVSNAALNLAGGFSAPLAAGDLVMIIQNQGAAMTNPDDSTYGAITNYSSCGNYEIREVSGVPNSTTISITCALEKAYTASGHTQVVRLPRFSTLTINTGGSITCPTWNGTTGGVVAIEVDGSTTINSGGSIDASGRGFRGGQLTENLAFYGVLNFVYSTGDYGSEKGESIVGFQTEYDALSGRFCKGAPANGGGGANSHNAGGGGGGNAGSVLAWTGRGNPDNSNATYATAWNLEYTGFASATSSGGGKGGYTFSSTNQNALVVGPFNTVWGGDYRRDNGGRGGRPLDYSTGRIFFGGGGGAGDQNDGRAGAGGNGGGIVFFTTRGKVSGAGNIQANGADGINSIGNNSGNDGAGGAGGGGVVIIDADSAITGITINANGGRGGNQNVGIVGIDAYGPGGGGGGGYIAISNGAVVRNANGGNNGVTSSNGMNEFPPNGATKGGQGLPLESYPTFSFSAVGDTVCVGTSTTLSATVTGTLPAGSTLQWYSSSTGSTVVGSGSTFTTPTLNSTTTYYIGTCPGFYRIPVTVVVVTSNNLFTATSGCLGTVTNFSGQGSTSFGIITNWTWNFNDGSITVNGQNTSHTFSASGTYQVTLTTTNSFGCTFTSTSPVIVQPTPVSNFSTSTVSGCNPLTVPFTNASSGATAYSWNFGDGTLGTAAAPVHTYTSAGVYSVTLITNAGTCGDTLVRTAYITVFSRPTASFSVAPSVCLGDTFYFTNTTSGSNNSYVWNFGDGSVTSSLINPTHSYSTAGSYQVRLTSTSSGCSDDTVITVTVNPSPQVAFSSAISSGCAPLAVVFSNTTTGAPSYSWTFGDGGISTLASPSHTFTTPGVYTVTLIATQGSCSDTLVRSNYMVVTARPTSSFNVTDSVCNGNLVSFTNTSTGNGSTITGYSWNFGDATALSNSASPTHAYSAPGNYVVTLTASNTVCADDSTFTINVGVIPVVQFSPSTDTACGATSIVFSNTTLQATSYSWNFGDGSSSSSASQPSHLYTNIGSYTVQLIGNNARCSDTASTLILVKPQPISSFVTANVCSGDSVRFTNSSNGNGGAITSYSWSFGDGSATSTALSPAHYYVAAGTYQVRLTVSNGFCTDDTVLSVSVNPAPVAAFTTSVTNGCGNSQVAFTNSTTANPSYSWNFGDNTSLSSLANPTHGYTASGNYIVTLIATQGSCIDTVSQGVTVVVTPVPNCVFTTSNVCLGDTSYFTNLSSGLGVLYSWDFGDNQPTSAQYSPTHYYSTAGSYSVTLSATVGNCVSDTSIIVNVNPAPQANISASSSSGCAPLTINFSNTSTGSPTYAWSFGDGTYSSQSTPSHIYTGAGLYNVQLIAEQGSCSDTAIFTVSVSNGVSAVAGASNVCQGDSVRFTNTSTGATAFTWNFGDGGPLSVNAAPVHLYSSSGNYQVVMIATNGGGCTDTTSFSVSVSPLPLATFICPTTVGCDTLTAYFTANAGSGTSYQWLFGDGTGSNNSTPVHFYTTPGIYTVTLTTVAPGGCSSTRSQLNFIQVRDTPQPTIVGVTNPTLCLNDCIGFSGQSTGTPTSWTWGFPGASPSASFGQNISNVCYRQTGDYDVRLTVSDGYCSGTTVSNSLIHVVDCSIKPSANFIVSDTVFCENACVSFVSLSLNSLSWNWSFPGGTPASSTDEDPVGICYFTPGVYPVTLIATNPVGSDTLQISNLITVAGLPPIPSFSQIGDTLIAPAGYSYQWYFNGIPISGAIGQRYIATLSGSYSLSITNFDGCRAISQPQHVSLVGVDSPGAGLSFSMYPNPVRSMLLVQLSSSKPINARIRIVDVLGRSIFSTDLQIENVDQVLRVDMENYAAGTYFLFFENGSMRSMHKIVKVD